MKIRIRDIPQDATIHLGQDLDPGFLGLEELGAKPTGPVRCELDAGLSGGGFFAIGTLSVPVVLECVSCLETFEKTLEVPEFATQIELAADEIVDLTDCIREDILLNLPPHPKCDVDGARQCSAHFPTAPGAPLTEESIADSSAWNALNQLKPKQ
ncbi:MAG: YceD family protein [Chthoniobacterales bacterium]